MRAIAEFVMRGRLQAIGVCVFGALLPPFYWLTGAVLGLIVLRKGINEGVYVLLWSCLPLIVLLFLYGQVFLMLVLIGTVALAYVLRASASWELTIAASVVVAGICALLLELVSGEMIADIAESYVAVIAELQAQAETQANQAQALLLTFDQAYNMVFGSLAVGIALNMVLFLVLARWWQSELYNPGGFGEEFRRLRLSPIIAAALIGVIVILMGIRAFTSAPFQMWIGLVTLPMVLASIALVHWTVNEKGLSRSWLFSFYLMMIFMFQLVTPVLVATALIDSWFDLRKFLRRAKEE
jgi:hypothetical protein